MEIAGGYAVVDAGGRRLACVYKNTSLDQGVNSETLTDDEARRIAANIAKIPHFVHKHEQEDRGSDVAARECPVVIMTGREG